MTNRLTSTLTVFAVMGLFALAGSCAIAPAYAHSDEVVRCITHKAVTKIGTETVLPNGLVMEYYDTNGNGVPDLATLSISHMAKLENGELHIEHATHPTFYMTNYNEDEDVEQVFIDKGGEGKCSDIVLYHDFNQPQTPNAPNMDRRKEARS